MIISFLNRQSRHDPEFYRSLAQRLFDAAEARLEPLRLLAAGEAGDPERVGVARIGTDRSDATPLKLAVSLTLAGPIVMRRINREQRQIDRLTDILSFPMLDCRDGRLKKPIQPYDLEIGPDGGRTLFLGDLFLSPDRAVAQAEDYGHSLERETAFLLTHGLLHLLGYDHKNRRQEAAMQRLIEEFLASMSLTRPG